MSFILVLEKKDFFKKKNIKFEKTIPENMWLE